MKFGKKLGTALLVATLLASSASPAMIFAENTVNGGTETSAAGKNNESGTEKKLSETDNKAETENNNEPINSEKDKNSKDSGEKSKDKGQTSDEKSETESENNNIEGSEDNNSSTEIKGDAAEKSTDEMQQPDDTAVQEEKIPVLNNMQVPENIDEIPGEKWNYDIGDGLSVHVKDEENGFRTVTVTGEGTLNKGKWRAFVNECSSFKEHESDQNIFHKLNINIKDPIKFPKDSSYLFANILGSIEINHNVDTGDVTNMRGMFFQANNADPDVSAWDTSNVTDMTSMFDRAFKANPDTANWNTGKVRNMSDMFLLAENANPDVSKWDTSNVTNMKDLFCGASKAMPVTSNWNTSKVTNMSGTFCGINYSNPDVSNFDTSNVTDMSRMFYWAKEATPDTSKWNTDKVTDMSQMFRYAKKANPDVSNWDTSQVTNMSYMFHEAKIAEPDTSNWDTGNVTDMSWMFKNAKKANPDVSGWNTGKVTNMAHMFRETDNANPDVSNWDTSQVTDMEEMFLHAEKANPEVSKWKTGNVRNMRSMFNGALAAEPNTSKWDTGNVIDMSGMFGNTKKANPNVSNWKTGNVKSMVSMFSGAAVANPDVKNWDTSNVTEMYFMFKNALSANPDVSLWNTEKVRDMFSMFENCGFKTLDLRKFRPDYDYYGYAHYNDEKIHYNGTLYLSRFIVHNNIPETVMARGDFLNNIKSFNGISSSEFINGTHLIFEINGESKPVNRDFIGNFQGRKINLLNTKLKAADEFKAGNYYKITLGHKIIFNITGYGKAYIKDGNKDIYNDNLFYAENKKENFEIAAVADDGYKLESISSMDVNIKNNVFEMPDKDVVINVKFSKVKDNDRDKDKDKDHNKGIESNDSEVIHINKGNTGNMLNKEKHYAYLFGYKDWSFRPDGDMTRAEAAAMFSRLMTNYPEGESYSVNYSDVRKGKWYYEAIAFLNHEGILKGYPDGTFRPDSKITRAEFSAIASRFDNIAEGNMSFSDVSKTYWAYRAINSAAAKGWVKGYPDGTFKPENNITRAEVTALTNNMLNREADRNYVDSHEKDLVIYNDVKGHWSYYEIEEATNGHDYSRKGSTEEIWEKLNHEAFLFSVEGRNSYFSKAE